MNLVHLLLRRLRAVRLRVREQRGDVPGWVLVTVMTAGLCAALYGLADDQLRQMLTDALASVR